MCLGLPARIIAIVDPQAGIARAETNGVRRQINIALLADTPDAMQQLVGQWVLLHVGFAMVVIDQEEADSSLRLLDAMAYKSDIVHTSDKDNEPGSASDE